MAAENIIVSAQEQHLSRDSYTDWVNYQTITPPSVWACPNGDEKYFDIVEHKSLEERERAYKSFNGLSYKAYIVLYEHAFYGEINDLNIDSNIALSLSSPLFGPIVEWGEDLRTLMMSDALKRFIENALLAGMSYDSDAIPFATFNEQAKEVILEILPSIENEEGSVRSAFIIGAMSLAYKRVLQDIHEKIANISETHQDEIQKYRNILAQVDFWMKLSYRDFSGLSIEIAELAYFIRRSLGYIRSQDIEIWQYVHRDIEQVAGEQILSYEHYMKIKKLREEGLFEILRRVDPIVIRDSGGHVRSNALYVHSLPQKSRIGIGEYLGRTLKSKKFVAISGRMKSPLKSLRKCQQMGTERNSRFDFIHKVQQGDVKLGSSKQVFGRDMLGIRISVNASWDEYFPDNTVSHDIQKLILNMGLKVIDPYDITRLRPGRTWAGANISCLTTTNTYRVDEHGDQVLLIPKNTLIQVQFVPIEVYKSLPRQNFLRLMHEAEFGTDNVFIDGQSLEIAPLFEFNLRHPDGVNIAAAIFESLVYGEENEFKLLKKVMMLTVGKGNHNYLIKSLWENGFPRELNLISSESKESKQRDHGKDMNSFYENIIFIFENYKSFSTAGKRFVVKALSLLPYNYITDILYKYIIEGNHAEGAINKDLFSINLSRIIYVVADKNKQENLQKALLNVITSGNWLKLFSIPWQKNFVFINSPKNKKSKRSHRRYPGKKTHDRGRPRK